MAHKQNPLQGVRRINVGGKLLTNYLKELVSYRWGCAARNWLCGQAT